MAKDCQELTVHAVSFVPGRGPVFYASMPWAAKTLKGCGTNRAEEKHRLVSLLWDHLVAMESPFWRRRYTESHSKVPPSPPAGYPGGFEEPTQASGHPQRGSFVRRGERRGDNEDVAKKATRYQSSDRAAFPIQVVCGQLGRPHLLLGKYRGPAISFSEGEGKVWAALCGDESGIGIDVAGADEFQREYPFHRVFHPEELEHALRIAGGDIEKASALLWSIKEAVVKALGCAFHLVDPRQITVYPSVGGDGGYTFPVGLSGKALARFPLAAGRSLWARSVPRKEMWLSIALSNRKPTGHE